MSRVTLSLNCTNPRSPLQSHTYRPKGTPDFVPTGRGTIQPEEPEDPILQIFPQSRKSGKKAAKEKKQKTMPPINEKIKHAYINYIDANGQYHENTERDKVLGSFNKAVYKLVEVDGISKTCRLFTSVGFKEHMKKLGHGSQLLEAKEIQMTWNVGENDLQYRLRRAMKAMEKGGRCTIILGARNPKLVRTKKEREDMVQSIRNTLEPYGFEWKEMVGGFPSAEISFQGHPPDTTSQVSQDSNGSNDLESESKDKDPKKKTLTPAEVEAARIAAAAEAEAARMAELNQDTDPAKKAKEKEAQEKLRSVAAQFSTLGAKKSLFGARLGGRSLLE
jgi:translation initiation factor IF-3